MLGEAADGEAAVEAVERLRPDVLLLDLVMPKLDGFGVLDRLSKTGPVPTVILTSRANRSEVRSAFEALRAGAIELLPKPEDPDSWRQLSETLPRVLRAAAAVERPVRSASDARVVAARPRMVADESRAGELRWLALGRPPAGPRRCATCWRCCRRRRRRGSWSCSTSRAASRRAWRTGWRGSLGLDVRVAVEGERPRPGTVRIAPAGAHLLVGKDERLTLDAATPTRRGHRPSVDELFHSLAATAARATAAVVLTGMGTDGAEGLAELRRAGALCFAQDEASSAVYGMPKAALEAGGAEVVAPPRAIGEMLARRLGDKP